MILAEPCEQNLGTLLIEIVASDLMIASPSVAIIHCQQMCLTTKL